MSTTLSMIKASVSSSLQRAPIPSSMYANEINLQDFDPSHDRSISVASFESSDSVLDDPPPYMPSTNFIPTTELQIETVGKPFWSPPLSSNRNPILVFAIAADGSQENQPMYISKRPPGCSGSSCFLSASNDADETPLSTTTYRFGPSRHPWVSLVDDSTTSNTEIDAASNMELGTSSCDSFQVLPCGLLTRAQRFNTRLGTFEWRYASRKERKALGANSLLILDRIVKVFHSRDGRNSAKDEEVRTPVAHLLRSTEFRSAGSTPYSAGNGGRLQLDLRPWKDGETMQTLAVTTCLTMLKKEMDRRSMQQMGAMGAIIGAAA